MDFDPDSSDFARFLQKALDIQVSEPAEKLTEDSLKQIALRAGLSEEDWQRVSENLEQQLQKGRNFLRFENYPDAIEALEEAVSLAPYRPDVLLDCGKAHLYHGKQSGDDFSLERAEELFRKCLVIEPGNAEAAKLLSELKETRTPKPTGHRKIIAGAAAIAILVVGGFLLAPNSEPTNITVTPASKTIEGRGDYPSFREDGEVVFRNSLEMPFVAVPIIDAQRDVSSLLFCIYETRIRDYREFMNQSNRNASKSLEDGVVKKWDSPGYPVTENHPVSFVSWHDARAFCQWLTQKEREAGIIGGKDRYRLPTDHEWSCAVGIGLQEHPKITPKFKHHRLRGVYPWGAELPPSPVPGNYLGPETEDPIAAPFLPDGFKNAAPVGSFPVKHWGIYDLGGNLWEWCEDQWDVEMVEEKTLRGAAFDTRNPKHLLSSGRRWIRLGDFRDVVGFRVVLERE